MAFIGGSVGARKLFDRLQDEGLLCMPYSDEWMKQNAENLDTDYKRYEQAKGLYPRDKGLVFIDTSRFYGDRLRELVGVLPAFGTIYKDDATSVNPDVIVLNLLTQKMIAFGLGRKDRAYAFVYIDGQFKYVSSQTYNAYINLDFETVDDEGEIAVDPVFRYLQELCGDYFEIIDNVFNALEAFGAANFEFVSLPLSYMEIDEALGTGPNEDGVYEIDGEEFSEEELRDLEQQHDELGADCARHLAFLQVLFPAVEHGDLATGAY